MLGLAGWLHVPAGRGLLLVEHCWELRIDACDEHTCICLKEPYYLLHVITFRLSSSLTVFMPQGEILTTEHNEKKYTINFVLLPIVCMYYSSTAYVFSHSHHRIIIPLQLPMCDHTRHIPPHRSIRVSMVNLAELMQQYQ